MNKQDTLPNFIGGAWQHSSASSYLDVTNPASGAVLAQVPLSPSLDVDKAVTAGLKAFQSWRRVPATDRIRYLFDFPRKAGVSL